MPLLWFSCSQKMTKYVLFQYPATWSSAPTKQSPGASLLLKKKSVAMEERSMLCTCLIIIFFSEKTRLFSGCILADLEDYTVSSLLCFLQIFWSIYDLWLIVFIIYSY